MDSQALRKHVQWAEAAAGPELFPYRDTVGVLTVGYGRNLDAKGITQGEAELMLDNDINDAVRDAQSLSYWLDLDHVRQLVIVDMIYNLGLTKFNYFKRFNAAMVIGDYLLAGAEMKDSRWYNQTHRRATVLVQAMQTGVWNA